MLKETVEMYLGKQIIISRHEVAYNDFIGVFQL